MSREGELTKNTFILSFGTVVPKLVSLVTLPILTGCLSKADYGTYDLVVSMVSLLLPLLTLELQSAAFRFLIDAREDRQTQRGIVTNILLFTLIISLTVLVVLFFLLTDLSLRTRLLIVGYYFFDILVCTLRQIARGLSRNELYSISVLVNALVEGLGIAGFVLLLSARLDGALLAAFAGQLCSLLFLTWRLNITRYLDLHAVSLSLTRRMLSYSWPLIPNSLASWVINLSDRLILTMMMGIEASAVYAAASKIPNVLGIVQGAFTLAWQENASLSTNDEDKSEYYSNVFDTVFCLVAGCLALLIAASPILFTLLIQGDYEDAYIHMNILFLGVFASCVSAFFGGIYVAHMNSRAIGTTTTVVAIVNVVAKLLLVPALGIFGSSICYVACFALLAIYRGYDVRRFQSISYKPRKIVGTCVYLICLVAISSLRVAPAYVVCAGLGVAFAIITNWKICRLLIGRISSRTR